ncbi:MAG: type III toxin-antitoxin system ToxN/AbiQ family toxin [Clostridium sp.]|nr:type III toxin-antitoxin system ToxN/AbiQ family toxin [Clostridium sp.]
MKYIRNVHNIDSRIFSVSSQAGKDERPFLGVILVCNEHKYCVPLSKPKKKHEKMRDKIDFNKMELVCNKYNQKIQSLKAKSNFG